MEGLEPDAIKALQADKNFQVLLRRPNTTGYLAFNFHFKEFQDVKVRQAFAHAINKKAIVDAFYGGTGLIAKTFLPPALWGYNDKVQDYPYDVAKAKATVDGSRVPAGAERSHRRYGQEGAARALVHARVSPVLHHA